MKNILASIILALVMVSCSSLPSITNDKSVLIIPIKNEKKDFSSYYVYYRLYYTRDNYDGDIGKKYFTVKPKNDMIIIKDIEPGSYDIYGIEPVYIESGKIFTQTRLILNFNCLPNEITILNKTFEISFIKSSSGKFSQHAEFIDTTNEKIESIKFDLNKDKNIKTWKY